MPKLTRYCFFPFILAFALVLYSEINAEKGLFYIIIPCSCLSYFSMTIQPKRQNILFGERLAAMNSVCFVAFKALFI